MRATFWIKIIRFYRCVLRTKLTLREGGGMAKMRAPFWIKITLDYWQKKSENAQFYRHVLRTKSTFGGEVKSKHVRFYKRVLKGGNNESTFLDQNHT